MRPENSQQLKRVNGAAGNETDESQRNVEPQRKAMGVRCVAARGDVSSG